LIKTSFILIALLFVGSRASAMPLVSRASIVDPDAVVKAKIICEEDGRCYQRGRPPVARWIYGEKSFWGPYVGPGYYGSPAYHSRWWFF
jgi:hypothetical protein